ncbi:hypothetical protein TARUN_8674 [Trichoderma arundinaceum]|uniref:Copper acquisition factor BIM1-like domain-containing protein n=1 Tax=Trichoderma arundinaceum TaxID=490622 RepID=A0A395NCX7_TRIAR|nr:hypothetical protein TARUN_8674 [Trichoderma arundinaceum]
MAFRTLVLALAASQAVSAHFGLVYPEWRADTLAEENEDKYSQWNYPCGGVPYKAGNITNWPIGGGSLTLELHHPWTYVYVNLGLGANTTNFNVSLTPEFLNVTGKGTLCIDKLPVPLDDVADGTLASIQVVTSGESGNALYNCADIRFTRNATQLSNCSVPDGMVMQAIKEQNGNDTEQDGASEGNTTSTDDKKNAAGFLGTDRSVLATVVGLAVAFSLGLGI